MRDYLLTYHSTKHPSTGKSPGELMFGRRIKSKVPSIMVFHEDSSVRERDAVIKEKGKEYGDKKRNAKHSEIKKGDIVLVKRMRKNNKLDTNFSNEEFVVQNRAGADTIIRSTISGKEYRRNSAHLKKVSNRDHDNQDDHALVDAAPREAPSPIQNDESTPESTHEEVPTKRWRKFPSKYDDYIAH